MIKLIFGSSTLELPAPAKDDSTNLNPFTLRRRTRGNEIRVFRDPRWPMENIMTFNLETLTDDLQIKLERFIDKCVGQAITLIDHHEISHSCFILNPNSEYVEERDCAFSTELRLQKL